MPAINSYGRSIEMILALTHRDASRMRAKFMDEMRDLVGNSPTAREAASPLDLPPNARLVALCDIGRLEVSRLAVFADDNADARTYFEEIAKACDRIGAATSADVFRRAAAKASAPDALATVAEDRDAVTAEIPDRLREWVASNLSAIEAEA